MSLIFDITKRRTALNGDGLALREVATGQEITYSELNTRADLFAVALRGALGRAQGDRVGILTHNNAAFFEILFACGKAGVILVPLNWRLTPSELAPLLEDAGIDVLLHDHNCAELSHSLAASRDLQLVPIHTRGDAPTPGSYQALMAEADPAHAPVRDDGWAAEDTWYMLYTSGTTGIPKAVRQTFGMAMANYVNVTQTFGLSVTSRSPNFLPLFHTAGVNLHSMPILISGGTVDVLPGFDPDMFMAVLAEGKTTTIFAVPAVYQALRVHPKFEEIDFGDIPYWGSGGAALPDAVVELFRSKGINIYQGWGMTETGPAILFQTDDDATRKIGSVGRPLLLGDVKIVADQGRDVPVGEAGELLARGPLITPGYWNRPEANAKTFTEDGWMHTGDVARCDEDGCYFLVDRIKDMYISGAENVYPAEIENVLAGHPDILEAAVVGVDDTTWGEVGCAFVMARPGHTPDEADVLAYCRERLAGYKIPKSMRVLDDFPRTAAGKVRKHILKAENL